MTSRGLGRSRPWERPRSCCSSSRWRRSRRCCSWSSWLWLRGRRASGCCRRTWPGHSTGPDGPPPAPAGADARRGRQGGLGDRRPGPGEGLRRRDPQLDRRPGRLGPGRAAGADAAGRAGRQRGDPLLRHRGLDRAQRAARRQGVGAAAGPARLGGALGHRAARGPGGQDPGRRLHGGVRLRRAGRARGHRGPAGLRPRAPQGQGRRARPDRHPPRRRGAPRQRHLRPQRRPGGARRGARRGRRDPGQRDRGRGRRGLRRHRADRAARGAAQGAEPATTGRPVVDWAA